MKKLFLFLTLFIAGITANAQFTPYNNLNYVKLLKTPPAGAVEDSVLVFDSSDGFVKMRPASEIPSKATATKSGTVKTDVTETDPIVYTKATLDAKLELKTENSAGAISGFGITNNGNGTVNIANGVALLRIANTPTATLIKYPIPAVTNLTLTDNVNNYVLVDYNGGTPAITVTTSPGTINTTTNSLIYVISRVGNTLDYVPLVGQNVDANAKLRRRFLNSEGLNRAYGAVLNGVNRNLTVTAGLYNSGLIEVPTPAFNTSTGSTFTQVYENGSTWIRTTGNTQINNTQYNNAGVLTNMPTNDYRVDYVYILANNPSKLYVILGNTTYANIANARLAPVPANLPSELQAIGTRIGRVIIQRLATTMEVSSEFATVYNAGSATLHNDLGGLNAGDFQHLTAVEKATVEYTTNKATDFTTVNNILYPSVRAVKVQLDAKSDKLERVFYLSQHGCISDADLSISSTTFGTNNTAAIQAVLNEASDGTPIKVIVDGKYSTNGLVIYSNTTIEASSQSNGFILRSNSNAPMFINAHPSSTTIIDTNIEFQGGTYNFNGVNQVHNNPTYGLITGINLVGVKNVWIKDCVIYNPSTYCMWFLRWENIHVTGCVIDTGVGVTNKDGLHFNGLGENAFVENNIIRFKDDAIAFTADDSHSLTPYPLYGDQKNIFIRNNIFKEGRFGLRFLSGASKMSNILVDGLSGETTAYAIIIDNFWQNTASVTLAGNGNIDDITLKNINVKVEPVVVGADIYESIINIATSIKNLTIDGLKRDYSGYTDSSMIFIEQDYAVIENFTLRNVYDWVDGDSSLVPLLNVGSANIRNLTMSNIYKKRATLVDSPVLTLGNGTINNISLENVITDNVQIPIKLGTGSTVNRLKLVNVSALNKTNAYPLISNNTNLPLLESKNSIDGNLWSGSGTITKAWADNNFPESVYGITEAAGTSDGRLSTTKFVDDNFLSHISPQYIGGSSAPTDAVLELREDSIHSSALKLTNRNNTRSWYLGVDLNSVDDGTLYLQDRTAGQTGLSINSSGIVNFQQPPTVPTPTTGSGVANRDYVDNATTTSGTITTSTNITNATLTDSSLPQNGKTLLISNAASNINYTVNGSITASFVKGGTGVITFVQGSGRTMVAANGTLVFNGAQYSTASVVSFGTTDVVYINNF